ncbi:amidohydrolase family protein [Novosphingobium pentaromativorans]|nr:amidohydrolase family protein [Novosphingobium pentaromativorans]AIT79858.1 hydrolase [Novosphingobium pentaromativorans US6-1]
MSVTELEKHSPADSLANIRLTDADAHIDPPHHFWKEYLPAHLRDLAPVIEEGEEHDWVVFEGKRRPLFILNNQAGRSDRNYKAKGKLAELHQTSTPAQRLADMDRDGVTTAILFGGGPLGTSNSELYIESFRAYNRFLADFCAADPKRLVGVAYLPMRDVNETVSLLREAIALGHRSVNMPAFPQAADGISTSAKAGNIQMAAGAALAGDPSSTDFYWQPVFEPLWREIVDNDIAVTFHLGGRLPRFGEPQHFLPDLLMSKLAMAEPVAMAIFGGLFDRFPTMRWGIIESGVGWMSWATDYMDKTWEKQRFWSGCDIKNPPSHYMDANIWGSFIHDRTGVLNRNLPGGRNIMWSSDYPHSETCWPNSRGSIAHDMQDIPLDDVRQIVDLRARSFFRVD